MANSTEGKSKTSALKAGGHNYGAYNTERDSLGLGINAWIDQYMTDNLSAPPKEDYAEFIEAYTDITERAERIVREKEQKRREKRQAKEEKRQQREKERRAIVDKFLLDLESLIDEPYRSSAMKKVSDLCLQVLLLLYFFPPLTSNSSFYNLSHLLFHPQCQHPHHHLLLHPHLRYLDVAQAVV